MKPLVAPYKCVILPISPNKELDGIVSSVKDALNKNQLSHRIDESSISIGKRYARTDELGIPFAITVDFDSVKDNTVTLRDLPSMTQVRLPVSNFLFSNLI